MNDNEFTFSNDEPVANTEPINNEVVEETPVEPTEPVQPVETTPVTPVTPAEPTAPVEPVVLEAPAEPVQPVEEVQPVQPVETAPVEPTPEVPAEPVVQPTQPEPINMDTTKKKGSVLPVILIVFFLLIISGCLVYVFFLKDKIGGNTNNTTTTTVVGNTNNTTTTTAVVESSKEFLDEITKGNLSIETTKLKTVAESGITVEGMEVTKKDVYFGGKEQTVNLFYDACVTADDEECNNRAYLIMGDYVIVSDSMFNVLDAIVFNSNNKEYLALSVRSSYMGNPYIYVIDSENNMIYETKSECLYADYNTEDETRINIKKIDDGITFVYYFGENFYNSTLKVINGKVVITKGEINDDVTQGGMC